MVCVPFRLPRALMLLAGFAPLLVAAPASAAETFNDAQRAEIKSLVREYLVEHPEVIAEAIDVLRERQQKEEMERNKSALKSNSDALFHSKGDPVLGNPDGDVTVVEFFDYRCGYCKAVAPHVMEVIKGDGKVRLVLKELPILGPDSIMAARWSLAARKEKAYQPFHTAMMKYKGTYTAESLGKMAEENGLDAKKIAAAADSDEISQILKANMQLARELGINGTPAFVVGDHLVPGAMGPDDLKELIADARESKAK